MSTEHWDLDQLLTDLSTRIAQFQPGREMPPAQVTQALQAVANALEGRYYDPQVVGLGGTGIVVKIHDSQLGGRASALKISIPDPETGQRLSASLRGEVAKLAKLRHGSLIRLQGYQTLRINNHSEISYLISEWIDGLDSGTYLRKHETSEARLLEYLKQVVDGIAYLHRSGVAHLDIKPENILIGLDGQAYIADLGSAKFVSSLDDDTTLLSITPKWADKEVMQIFADDLTMMSVSRGVPRRSIRLRWDFAPLGRTLLFWLNRDPFSRTGESSGVVIVAREYTRRYLLLMAARLLGVQNVPEWLLEQVGISVRLLSEIQYLEASDVYEDLEKLTGEYAIDVRVPELSEFPASVIQITSDAPAPFTPRVKALVEHPVLGRLGAVTQLGIVSQVYPTANHSRLEHSLGTFHNVCRIIRSLWLDPLSPLFRQLVNEYDLTALLAASLLHDAGQFPLAHDLEEIAPQIFDHERLTRAILSEQAGPGRRPQNNAATTYDQSLFSLGEHDYEGPSLRQVLTEWGTSAERVTELLVAKPVVDRAPLKDRVLHSLIDGPIDADKLDYLVRDSNRLGVPYGLAIDVDRIIRNLTVVVDEQRIGRSIATIGVHEKGRVAAEFVTIARSAMFAQAYWHHTVRAMKAMLSRAVDALIVKRGLRDSGSRRRFTNEFESFVLGLPGTLHSASGRVPSTLNPNDAAVLEYLRDSLRGSPESELLLEILERRYYRRVVVYSLENEKHATLANAWGELDAGRRARAHEALERRVLERLEVRLSAGPTTEFLDSSALSLVRSRTMAGLPVLIVDVPARRAGSDVPLYFAREASVRELRRAPRALGAVEQSPAWGRFGSGMRETVGKMRIFGHPSCVDAMEAVADRSTMRILLNESMLEVE